MAAVMQDTCPDSAGTSVARALDMASHDHGRPPLGAYAGLIAGMQLALALITRRRVQRQAAGSLRARDIALYGIATHKIANIVADDRVTRVVRAPFVEVEDGEEHPAGEGAQRAMGEMLTCPYCVGSWVAVGLAGSHAIAPSATRFVASIFATVTVADFLNKASAALHR